MVAKADRWIVQTGSSISEWVGQRVGVQVIRDGEPRRFKCKLIGVDAFGIITEYDTAEAKDQIRFFPWSVVLWVHQLKSGD